MPLIAELQPFIDAMNNDPTDWQRVGVLGDFLQDRADVLPKAWVELAPGFLALSHHKRQPWWYSGTENWGWNSRWGSAFLEDSILYEDWLREVEVGRHIIGGFYGKYSRQNQPKNRGGVIILKAAARGFIRMSEKNQQWVMSLEPGKFE